REVLLSYRRDLALGLSGIPIVEDAKFQPGNVFLNYGFGRSARKILNDVLSVPGDYDATATLANIGLQHDRVGQPLAAHELVYRSCLCDSRPLGDARDSGKNFGLGLSYKAPGRYSRIGCREQGERSMPDPEKQDVWHDRNVRQPRRPELPANPAPKPTEQAPSRLPAGLESAYRNADQEKCGT